jgi:hypothetical protein
MMSKYSTANGIFDVMREVSYYDVVDARYADDIFLPTPFRVFATCVPGQEWAMDEEDAACMWAEKRWSNHDYPDEMEATVTHSDGRKWLVTVTVEAIPSFHGHSREVDT